MYRKLFAVLFSVCLVLMLTVLPFVSCSCPAPEEEEEEGALTTIASSSITNRGATLTWTSTKAGSTQVEYGETTAYGMTTDEILTPSTSHAVTLDGLKPETTYNYRVKTIVPAADEDDEDEVLVSTNKTFTTADKVVLRMGSVGASPTTNNPFTAGIGQSDGTHLSYIYEPLIRSMDDGTTVGVLAQSWTWAASTEEGVAGTWTINLNPEAKFANGDQVTAGDVVFSFETYNELVHGSVNDTYAKLIAEDPIVAVDDTTVTFTLAEFQATFIRNLSPVLIVPESEWEDIAIGDIPTYANDDMVGSGVFELYDNEAEAYEIYATRLDYWGGVPAIDRLNFIHYDNEEAELLALRNKDIDTVSTFQLTSLVPQLLGDPDIDVFQTVPNSTMMFYLNHRIEPFDITEVRQALNMVLDRQSIIDFAADGWGKVPVMLERDEAFPDIADGMEWPYEANTQAERIDLANAALDDVPLMSAYVEGETRTYDGTPMTFNIWSGDWQEHINVASLITEQLADVGISLNHVQMTTKSLVGATFRQTSTATLADWDTYVWGRAFSPEYDYFADQWGHHADSDADPDFVFTKRSCVYGWFSTEGMAIGDDLNELQTYPEGNATRDALIESTQLAWRDEMPAIPIYNNINAGTYRTDRFSGWQTDVSYIAYGAISTMSSIYNITSLVPLSYS